MIEVEDAAYKTLLWAAKNACNLFDQADTGRAIERLGHRGELARSAIEDLKYALLAAGGTVDLPPPTEQYRQFPRTSFR